MAKAKLKAKPAARPEAGTVAGKSIMESAQQIWLAGLGAFAKAQDEGGKLFETLIREGSSLEQKTRTLATGKVDEVRGAVETGVSQVRERTQETWDKLEQVFESRVSRALGKLGVPGRKELDELIRRVDEIGRQVRRLDLTKPVTGLAHSFNSTIRRTKDDLSDLVKDFVDVQLAALHGAAAAKAKPRRATRPAPVARKPAPARPGKPARPAVRKKR
jgi:poly(hydroxyalkanoate) granule-associated protein